MLKTLNLSPSSINLYRTSPLQFFYTYIAKLPPDTTPVQEYGNAGSVVHTVLEAYIQNNQIDIKQLFDETWSKYQSLQNTTKVKKSTYYECVECGVHIIKQTFGDLSKTQIESTITTPILTTHEYQINLKGIVDCIYHTPNGTFIVDWKTSSSVDKTGEHKLQGLQYAYLIYVKTGIVPTAVIFYYLKLGKKEEYTFTLNDILKHESDMKQLAIEIASKESIDDYELGDISSFFNNHKRKCYAEMERRNTLHNTFTYHLKLTNSYIVFCDPIPELLEKGIMHTFKHVDKNAHFIRQHSSWDGTTYFFKNNTLPIGFLEKVKKVFNDYAEHKKCVLKLHIDDTRVQQEPVTLCNALKDITLRIDQQDAVQTALEHKIGCLHIATGGGKTEIAAEIIRRLGSALFIVESIELLNQTKERFMKRFGCVIGTIQGDECDIQPVTVATIQTLDARINEFKPYLSTVNCVFVDECHHAKAKRYRTVLRYIPAVYRYGLSGSLPQDNDFVFIESNLGGIIYELLQTDLIDMQALSKPEIIMYDIQHNFTFGDWKETEKQCIIEHKERNDIIIHEAIKRATMGEFVVIIVNIIQHGEYLQQHIPNSIFIHGQVQKDVRKQIMKDAVANNIRVLIGTVIREGVDLPNIDTIIYACGGGNSPIRVIQSSGRVLRLNQGKVKTIVDFFDNGKYVKAHSRVRMAHYKTLNNDIQIVKPKTI